jgi:hypothetical protein
MSNNPEHLSNLEQSVETPQPSEQLEKLAKSPEKTVELSPRDIEARAEKARIEALKTAKSVESGGKEKAKQSSKRPRGGIVNKKELDKSFKKTMHNVQNELPAVERIFSKIIHNKAIERTSDVLGNTVARPNAILAGAFVAFILTLLTYTIAKTIGYVLSGSETMLAFIIGWIIGVIYDSMRILFTGKKL